MLKNLKLICTGILLAALLTPQAVMAQWTVFDPVSNVNQIQQIQQNLQQLQHWIDAITKYETMITQNVEKITHLTNIFKEAEKMGGFMRSISAWGKLIRTGFRLKWTVQNLVSTQAGFFLGIQRRAMNGIFNPDQDLREFNYYLEYSIGKTAESEMYKLDQIVNQDEEIRVYGDQLKVLSEQTANLQERIDENNADIEALQACDDCTDRDQKITALKLQNDALISQMQTASAGFRDLQEKSALRAQKIKAAHDKHRMFGKEIKEVTTGWSGVAEQGADVFGSFRGGVRQ